MSKQLQLVNRTGNDLFYQTFKQQNISVIFQVHHHKTLFDSEKPIKQIQLVHEQATIHAADGYSRATGNVGIAWITSEYGLTNAITGIGTAQLDSVPMVVFIEHQTDVIDHQLDVEGLSKTSVKYNYSIHSLEDLIDKTNRGIQIATSGRKGVVVIDYPASILDQKIESSAAMKLLDDQTIAMKPIKDIPDTTIRELINMIAQAKKPVLLVGGGTVISGANAALDTFLSDTGLPFASTLMGLGAAAVDHPLHLGMVGMHGTFAANKAIYQADLLLCLGVRFSDRITGNTAGFSPNSKKIQVEIDPAEINKRVLIDYPVLGDIKNVLEKINKETLPRTEQDWVEKVCGWHKTSARFHDAKDNLIDPSRIIQLISNKAASNAIVATDVGQHQMWTAHHYPFQQPRKFLTSGGFGTMGYGLPAAIGAATVAPNQQVICISGDGSIQMNIQELITAVRYQLNIKIAIFKNGYLGMVRQWQQLFYERNYSQVKITSPDYVMLAESFGLKGFHAGTITEAKAIIEEAFRIDGPVLMEFTIEDERNVYPIVPPGGNNTDAIEEEMGVSPDTSND